MGDDDGALQDLESLLQLAPDNKLYRCQHAIISRRLGHWDRAFSDYTAMRGLGKCISPASSPTHSTASGVKRTEIAETVRRIPRDDHTSLSDFRVTINHLTDIHDALFLQPSKAQAALSTPPAMRDTACIQRLSEVMATFRIFSDPGPEIVLARSESTISSKFSSRPENRSR